MSSEKQGKSTKGTSGLVFVGFLLIGLAVGLLRGNMAVALIVAMAITRAITGEW